MITLKEIVDSVPAFNTLLATRLPVKVAYRLKRISDKMQPILKSYEESRVELIKKYGEQTDKVNDLWKLKDENKKAFEDEYNELMSEEVDLDYTKIFISDLGSVDIEPQHIIHWLFETTD